MPNLTPDELWTKPYGIDDADWEKVRDLQNRLSDPNDFDMWPDQWVPIRNWAIDMIGATREAGENREILTIEYFSTKEDLNLRLKSCEGKRIEIDLPPGRESILGEVIIFLKD